MIKLNMNENPYLPPGNVIGAANKGLEGINRYSDMHDMNKLRELIGSYNNISSDKIIVAPGSDFLLREVIEIFSNDRKMIMVNPSFFPALQCAKDHSKKLIKIQLTPPNFKVDHDIILSEINEPAILVIDNPNNPTGTVLLKEKMVKEILDNENILLLVDEAYYEFCGQTFLNLIKYYPNLAITRSMDKAFSLAGLRIGYLIGGSLFIKKLSDFQTFLPQPSVYAAIEALKEPGYMEQNTKKIIKERGRIKNELEKIGCDVFPSNTNFLLIKSNIPDLAEELREHSILIKDLSGNWLSGFYRISIGLSKENNLFLSAMRDIYQKYGISES